MKVVFIYLFNTTVFYVIIIGFFDAMFYSITLFLYFKLLILTIIDVFD